jgi:hypothetical protein
MTTNKKNICCPSCGKNNTWQDNNPSRPFCSPRCKLIDLGDWASEQHRIPGEPAQPSDENEIKKDE